jgi:signal peptidase
MKARLLPVVEYAAALAMVAVIIFATLAVWEPVRVAGMSMSPALMPGDLVIVRKGERARRGSIALVRASGHGAVLHRVVGLGKDRTLITRGDANPVDDRERVGAGDVAGVVVRVVPAGKLLRRWRPTE